MPKMPKMKSVAVSPEAEACRRALIAAIGPFANKLGAEGMLAVAASLVGQLIAMQDQRSMTSAEAMAIVARNIESANEEVLANLRGPSAGRA